MTLPFPEDIEDFPNNVVLALKPRFETLPGLVVPNADAVDVSQVFMRPLRSSDPNISIGLIAAEWTPNESEIGQMDPAISRYLYLIQAFVKDADEERGLRSHAALSKRVRAMLYRDAPTRVALGSLSVQDAGAGLTERTQRWGVRQQRFMANEVQGSFLYLSTLEFWLETETV